MTVISRNNLFKSRNHKDNVFSKYSEYQATQKAHYKINEMLHIRFKNLYCLN